MGGRGSPLACFFLQAEDGIRDFHVTGVQTCALPIYIAPTNRRLFARKAASRERKLSTSASGRNRSRRHQVSPALSKIGRASCREREEIYGGAGLVIGLRIGSALTQVGDHVPSRSVIV